MRTGIILVNTGTPDSPTPDAVERYLEQFLMHDRIRPMPKPIWRWLLKRHILPRRKNSSAEKYLQIWTDEGSPLSVIQSSLAQKVEESIRQEGLDVRVASAMSFGAPSLKTVARDLSAAGCGRLLVTPMYPQAAFSTTGIVEDEAESLGDAELGGIQLSMIGEYSHYAAYLDAVAQSVLHAGFDAAKGDHLVMSYHSIPLADAESGDTYPERTRATSEEVAKRLDLPPEQHTTCYQCRFDKGRAWLSPFLRPELERLAYDPKIRRVFVACPNFSIDCLETLYDIQIVARNAFAINRKETLGPDGDPEESFVYVPCLNDSDAHVEVLRHLLVSRLQGASLPNT